MVPMISAGRNMSSRTHRQDGTFGPDVSETKSNSARSAQVEGPVGDVRIFGFAEAIAVDAERLLHRNEQTIVRRTGGTEVEMPPALQATTPAAGEQRGHLARGMAVRVAQVAERDQHRLLED